MRFTFLQASIGSVLGLLTLAGCATDGAKTITPEPVRAAKAASPEAHIHAGGVHVIAETPGTCPVCNVYEIRRGVVVRIRTQTGLGTGVVIDEKGSILTNAHVVGDADIVDVETFSGTIVKGTVERRAKDIDLAVVRTNAPDVSWTSISPAAKQTPVVGSTVYVIGHPAGLGWTLTTGIISGLRKVGEVQKTEVLQITAAVSPGNSGGPAFDSEGNWIGTVSSKLVGQGLENISFVIPAAELRKYLEAK